MFIDENVKYRVIEKISSHAFQALWVELQFERKSNIICDVIYRQHNSPETFQTYFDETLEKLWQAYLCLGRLQHKPPQCRNLQLY